MHIKGSRRRAGIAVAATLPLLAAAVAAGAPAQAASPQGRAVLAGSKPAWAKSSADRGPTAASAQVTAKVYLAGRDQAGQTALARAVSDPQSASYGHYLTPQQVQQRFGATAAQIAAVKAWLTGAGLTVTGANQHYLTVQGSAAAAQRAFAVQLHGYSKDGHVYRAPTAEATVPAAVAASVLSVDGLSTAPAKATHDSATPSDTLPGPGAAFVNSGPFSSYYGSKIAKGTPKAYGTTQPYVVQGYTGTQLRSAYGATASGLSGKGVTVAIVDAYDSPTIVGDAKRYAAAHGDAPYTGNQFKQVDAAEWTHTADDDCGASGWYGEQTLDVEAVHAIAPKAGITYVGAGSCYDDDLLAALNTIVDNRLATIVSNSWGEPELDSDPALDAVYNQTFTRGAIEGIGFYFSSGDNGDEVANTGTKQSDMPSSLPWVTAVGGTSLGIDKHKNYQFETGWGTEKSVLSADGKSWAGFPGPFTSGAGGGTSSRVPQPYYQKGIVPKALSTLNGGVNRVVPDIAADADPTTGFLVGQTQTFPDGTVKYSEYRIGGTSLASPLIAGIQALAQQANGFPLGFANPAIYARYGSSAYHDVTDHPYGKNTTLADVRVDFVNGVDASNGLVTSLRTLGKDSSLAATRGYDNVTGVGSPAAGYLRSYQHRHYR
ncbi:protease pro-enzyme activation domain-containing protein [Streptacidiphilus sp. N1-12]|uniref:Protease pro-enzyme activation domain-containing protein n=2 Tax=Streptacidiphilus alkalitolerans TaxID=3342712 RepID=A0ABV6V7K9_9ACTN